MDHALTRAEPSKEEAIFCERFTLGPQAQTPRRPEAAAGSSRGPMERAGMHTELMDDAVGVRNANTLRAVLYAIGLLFAVRCHSRFQVASFSACLLLPQASFLPPTRHSHRAWWRDQQFPTPSGGMLLVGEFICIITRTTQANHGTARR